MELIQVIIKQLTIAIASLLFLIKIKPMKFKLWKKTVVSIGFIVLTTITFIILQNYISEPYKTAIAIIITSLFLTVFMRERIEITSTLFVVIYASSYVLYLISAIFVGIITYPFNISSESIYIVVANCVLSLGMAFLLSKIKVDLSPLYKKYASGIFLSIGGIVIVLYGLFREGKGISDEMAILLIVGFILLGYGIYSWLRRETTISKDENARDIINKKQQDILIQKENDYDVLRDMHDYLAIVVHKDDKKLDAMQRAVEKLVMRSEQTDILKDAQKILEEINFSRVKAEKDYNNKIYGGRVLPKIGLQIIDAKFETVLEKAKVKKIDFYLETKGDVSGLEEIIPQFDLVNIIGDLTENAIIAIKHLNREQTNRKILFSMENNDNEYGLSISDSGIPFEMDVLIKLGEEGNSTHLDDGGSGYGYKTIFELLYEYGASLTITEYEPKPNSYSKNIAISFNGKTEYIIKSYRAELLRKLNTNTNLIIENS